MYKVLIVDNDEITVNQVKKIFEEKIKEGRVVCSAGNGKDALVQIINIEPDLILTAVRLPGMNGLKVIQQIRKFNKTVPVIIISAYDYFDFAKEAMILQVSDYILKPINVSSFVQSVKRVLRQLKEKEELIRRTQKEEHQLYDALRYVEYNFMYSILFNGKFELDCKNYEQLLGINRSGYILGLEIIPQYINSYWDIDKAMDRIHRQLKSIIGQQVSCVVGPKILNRIMLYISCTNGRDAKEEQVEAYKMARQISKTLKETFDIDVYIGIGTAKPLERIKESYEEAMKCLLYKKEGPIISTREIRHKNVLFQDYSELTITLLEQIKMGKEEALITFQSILESLRMKKNEQRVSILVEIFILLNYEAKREKQPNAALMDMPGAYKELIELSLEEQEAWAQRNFSAMLRQARAVKVDRKSKIIAAAVEYIEKHYNEEITLNEMADLVNLSPQHFSKIFKEATNLNYVECVTNIRMSKAKEFMNNTDKTIKEICYLVGYQDPNYFSRIFKKYVGVTPSEYLKEREK